MREDIMEGFYPSPGFLRWGRIRSWPELKEVYIKITLFKYSLFIASGYYTIQSIKAHHWRQFRWRFHKENFYV